MKVKALTNLIHDQAHRFKGEVFEVKDEVVEYLKGRSLVTTDLDQQPTTQAEAQPATPVTPATPSVPQEPETGAVEGEDEKLDDEADEDEGNPEDDDDTDN